MAGKEIEIKYRKKFKDPDFENEKLSNIQELNDFS